MSIFAIEESLRGEVRRVVFAGADGSFAILKVCPENGKKSDEVTVVGDLGVLQPGNLAEFTGRYEKHAEFGKQFRAKTFREIMPASADGLVRFLGSGAIPGIGMKLAKVLVDHFGEETINILSHQSKRISEAPGIGRKKAEAIRRGWLESGARREAMIFLQGLGITPLAANKLYRQYGEKTAEIVNTNPYRLADEVRGIGFLKADVIAASLGIAKDSPERLAAGAAYLMNQMIGAGHTCCPEGEFVTKCAEMLDQPEDTVKIGIGRALQNRLLVKVDDFLYSPQLASAELKLPRIIANLAMQNNFAGKKIDRVMETTSMRLSGEQHNAIEKVGYYPLTIITGGPGVGKTTVVGEIVRRAKKARLKIALAAPTGRAAQRLTETTGETAKTLHRLLQFDPSTGKFMHDDITPLNCDLLIVDEISMLDLVLAFSLFRAIKPGTSVILLGDPDQLPSVGAGTVLKSFLESGVFGVTELKTVFRQGRGSQIIENAHRVNHGAMPVVDEQQNDLSDFYWIKQPDPEKAIALIDRLLTDRIPQRFGLNPMRDVQVLAPMNKGTCGCNFLNTHLQELLNGADRAEFRIGERLFRQGDRIMQINNDYDKNVFNGDMGRILQIMHRDKKFLVDFGDRRIIEYSYDETENLALSYAVTVHKSQGSEFPAVILPLMSQHYVMLQRNLLYTAMTRAKKLLILIGSPQVVHMAVANINTEVRYSRLTEFLLRCRIEKGTG